MPVLEKIQLPSIELQKERLFRVFSKEKTGMYDRFYNETYSANIGGDHPIILPNITTQSWRDNDKERLLPYEDPEQYGLLVARAFQWASSYCCFRSHWELLIQSKLPSDYAELRKQVEQPMFGAHYFVARVSVNTFYKGCRAEGLTEITKKAQHLPLCLFDFALLLVTCPEFFVEYGNDIVPGPVDSYYSDTFLAQRHIGIMSLDRVADPRQEMRRSISLDGGDYALSRAAPAVFVFPKLN